MLEDARAQPAAAATEGRSDIAVPETIQSLIAARLDGLPAWERSLTQDASVVADLLVRGGRDDGRARVAQCRRGLGRPHGSRADRADTQLLDGRRGRVRLLPRAGPGGGLPPDPAGLSCPPHRLAAEWIESRIGDRAADRAELLAHHYLQAVELGRASGATDEAEGREAERRARRYSASPPTGPWPSILRRPFGSWTKHWPSPRLATRTAR